MNVTTNGFDVAKSIQDMGNLLKNITAQATGFQDKLMKVSVTETVTDPNLGKLLDVIS